MVEVYMFWIADIFLVVTWIGNESYKPVWENVQLEWPIKNIENKTKWTAYEANKSFEWGTSYYFMPEVAGKVQ